MKLTTFATLALSFTTAMTSAYVVPGKDWTGEEKKRSPMVVSGVDFDETGASTAPANVLRRDPNANADPRAAPWVVPGAAYEETVAETDLDVNERRGYKDGTYRRDAEAEAEAWVVPGASYDENSEEEEKRSYKDGTY
jgi:hypothetical protein